MGAYVALGCVCFFWGTTYLGIRVALESFSPEMLMFLRYTLSGLVLLIGARLKGSLLPTAGEAWRIALYGVTIIGCGTGTLVIAEQWIPSGLAALIVSLQPFWMSGVEAVLPRGERLRPTTLAGMLVGLAGVAFLIAPSIFEGQGTAGVGSQKLLRGFLLLQFGVAMWAVGSSAQKRLKTRAHPFVSAGVQQLATGLAFGIPSLFLQQHSVWDTKGIGAVLYLAIFGGVVGYSSYIFALDRLPVALVSIYTYINPLVAVWLGYLFYREPFGWREGLAMIIIFAGVALVKLGSKNEADPAPLVASE